MGGISGPVSKIRGSAQLFSRFVHHWFLPGVKLLESDVLAARDRSEFAADFELACQQRRLHLFVLPPRSPKLNGAVERANRTHTEEFYQVTPVPWK